MRPTVKQVERFQDRYAWANRILRIDLSNMKIEVQEASPYVPEYLEARGIAAKICWQEYAEPVELLGPANPLMIFTGVLTGSRSPYLRRSNCSYCKRVRDDQDYWQQVESYITAWSEARFSHGICPNCYEEQVGPQLEALEQQEPSEG